MTYIAKVGVCYICMWVYTLYMCIHDTCNVVTLNIAVVVAVQGKHLKRSVRHSTSRMTSHQKKRNRCVVWMREGEEKRGEGKGERERENIMSMQMQTLDSVS